MHIAVSLPTWMAKRNPFLVASKLDELAQLILELNNEGQRQVASQASRIASLLVRSFPRHSRKTEHVCLSPSNQPDTLCVSVEKTTTSHKDKYTIEPGIYHTHVTQNDNGHTSSPLNTLD